MSAQKPIRQILLGLLLSLTLYGAYFFDLVRKEYRVLLERQEALESLKLLGVPGASFLNDLGGLFFLKSSLFFLLLLGGLLALAQFLSLCLKAPWQRVLFFLLLLGGLIAALMGDRVQFSFPLVTALSCCAFFFITLGVRIQTSWKDLTILVLLGIVVSSALYIGAQHQFFVKTRDRILFDSSLGNQVVSYYYTYTPLAASVISPPQGVYEGLIYGDGFEDSSYHLGKGLVLSGDPAVKEAADFVVSGDQGGGRVTNRYGNGVDLSSPDPEEIHKAADTLFTMKGFKKLNRIALYVFPAALLFVPFFFLRLVTRSRKAFLVMAAIIATGALVFIGGISLIGTSGKIPSPEEALKSKNAGLSLAYHLYDRREVPSEYLPAVMRWARSESTALRYWGAKLLGYGPGGPEQEELLAELLKDPSPNIRYPSALSLYRLLGSKSFKELLPRLLEDPNWYVRCVIFTAFLRSGTIPKHM